MDLSGKNENQISISLNDMSEKEKALILAYSDQQNIAPGEAVGNLITELVNRGYIDSTSAPCPNDEEGNPSIPKNKDQYLILSSSSYEYLVNHKKIQLEGEFITLPPKPEIIHLEKGGTLYSFALLHTLKNGRQVIVSYCEIAENGALSPSTK